MPRKPPVRTVMAECPTPTLYRWLAAQASPYVSRLKDGAFVVHDEARWASLLSAAEGRELDYCVTLKANGRGNVELKVRDGVVVGACGSDPQRYIGLTILDAGYLCSGRKIPVRPDRVFARAGALTDGTPGRTGWPFDDGPKHQRSR